MRWIAALALVLAVGAINNSQSWDDNSGKPTEGGASATARRNAEIQETLIDLAVQTFAESDAPLTRARKERYNAALGQLMNQHQLFKTGTASLGSTLEPLDRLVRAGEPVLEREDYLRLLSESVRVAKTLEAQAKAMHKGGIVAMADVHDATFVRADLEARLLEAQAADKK